MKSSPGQSCGVLLAVIGPHWASVTDTAGRRRLDSAHDYTRLEIVTALQRPNVRVIPVLVDGAQMPDANDLPEDVQPLCRRNAIDLTDKRWNFDVSQLIETLRKALGVEPPKPVPRPEPAPEPSPLVQPWYRRVTKKQWGIVAAVVAVLGVLGEQGQNGTDTTQSLPPVMSYPTVQTAPLIQSNEANNYQAPADRLPLTGAWQDAEGGRYRFTKQGGQVKFEGMSPHGQVYGLGEMVNNMLTLNYALNGASAYTAQLELSQDGSWLRGRYGSAITGESGMVVLQRTP
ncbi:MAG: hypothetical protein WBX11_17250 [Thiobacillaceae bacterium]